MNIDYRNTITGTEVSFLRSAVGFSKVHPEQLTAGLDGSAFIVAGYDAEQVVGMSRLIWDGGAVACIEDVLVVPEYRKRGIENEMIQRILEFLSNRLKPGYGIQVDVKSWNPQIELYETLGFQVSTPQQRGFSMHICLTDQIELTDAIREI